jgi:hypothetical protein
MMVYKKFLILNDAPRTTYEIGVDGVRAIDPDGDYVAVELGNGVIHHHPREGVYDYVVTPTQVTL